MRNNNRIKFTTDQIKKDFFSSEDDSLPNNFLLFKIGKQLDVSWSPIR